MSVMDEEGLTAEEGEEFFCVKCKMKCAVEDLGALDANDRPTCISCMDKYGDVGEAGI